MSLNIKNEEVHRLVHEVALITGESQTTVVRRSVEERLARLRTRDGLAVRLLAIGKDCAARLPKGVKELDHGDWLYGDDGLPR
jgi:antitoxin VapB